jgi:hypothetical protein
MESKRGFDVREYRSISQDHLVVASLWFLLHEGKQASFENLVAEAFLSFPERFQLEGYSSWPNAHVVGKAWVRCRTDKKWIAGSASQGFKLTPLGEQVARGVMSQLRAELPPTLTAQRKGSRQSISSRVVLRIEGSPAYAKYKSGGTESVSEYEFSELLYCTLESTPEVFEKNFNIFSQEVRTYGREDLALFLDALRNKFQAKFVGKRSRGGLMPRKKGG